MATTIVTKNGSGAPTASDLVAGELAVDLTNGRLYTEDSGGTVLEIGLNPSGNLDVTGSVTADGLTVDGDTTINRAILSSTASDPALEISARSDTSNLDFKFTDTDGSVTVSQVHHKSEYYATDGAQVSAKVRTEYADVSGGMNYVISTSGAGVAVRDRLIIASNGDISFYEDTGTTPKFFWDASAERLSVPTLSITDGSITTTAATGDHTVFNSTGADADFRVRTGANTHSLYVQGNTGNVGIGASSPSSQLEIDESGSGDATIKVGNAQNVQTTNVGKQGATAYGATAAGAAFLYTYDNDISIMSDGGTGSIKFTTGGNTQKMVLDASGNLLVGKTYTATGNVGQELRAGGYTAFTRSGGNPLELKRLASDGDIVGFYKDSANVGSIGTNGSGRLYIASGDTGLDFEASNDAIRPCSGSGGSRDAAIDLGSPSARFANVYRSGSTISTSDRNMKQDIRDLTDAERNVAVAAKGLLKAFRFIDTVAAEGDSANIHFGIIAQDLAAAFEAEGLDANDYQVYRADTFTDDDGNEQTRLGICYENLLAFIIAAI